MFHVIVYMCTIVFCCLFEDHLQVLDFPVDNGGNNVPVAEELYCIFNILTINVYLIMYVTYFSQCTCDIMVHIQSMVGLLMYTAQRLQFWAWLYLVVACLFLRLPFGGTGSCYNKAVFFVTGKLKRYCVLEDTSLVTEKLRTHPRVSRRLTRWQSNRPKGR